MQQLTTAEKYVGTFNIAMQKLVVVHVRHSAEHLSKPTQQPLFLHSGGTSIRRSTCFQLLEVLLEIAVLGVFQDNGRLWTLELAGNKTNDVAVPQPTQAFYFFAKVVKCRCAAWSRGIDSNFLQHHLTISRLVHGKIRLPKCTLPDKVDHLEPLCMILGS
mgnify:CR=1 FL=1